MPQYLIVKDDVLITKQWLPEPADFLVLIFLFRSNFDDRIMITLLN